jgi:hypothetical protein
MDGDSCMDEVLPRGKRGNCRPRARAAIAGQPRERQASAMAAIETVGSGLAALGVKTILTGHLGLLGTDGSRRMRLACSHIVVVKLALLDLGEPVPNIELVGPAPTKCTHANGLPGKVRLRKDLRQYQRANALALMSRMNVQVIEHQTVRAALDHEEADAFAVDDDMTGLLGRETHEEALARPHRIEAADALQTLAHGLDSESCERLTVARRSNRELDRRGVHALYASEFSGRQKRSDETTFSTASYAASA